MRMVLQADMGYLMMISMHALLHSLIKHYTISYRNWHMIISIADKEMYSIWLGK